MLRALEGRWRTREQCGWVGLGVRGQARHEAGKGRDDAVVQL